MKTKSGVEANIKKTPKKKNLSVGKEEKSIAPSPSIEEIRELAYLIFHDRIASGVQSSPEEDWFVAESILNSRQD